MPSMTNVQSDLIKSVSYNRRQQLLRIKFNSNHDHIQYTYHMVPENVYKDMMKAESKGKFFNEFIKGKFTWTKSETFFLEDANKVVQKTALSVTENSESIHQ